MKNILFILITILFISCEPVVEYLPEMPVTEPPPIIEVEIGPETETESEIQIEYTNIFKVSGYQRVSTTQLDLRDNILYYDGAPYDLDEDIDFPFSVTYEDETRIITMGIDVDVYSFFYFMNDNMLVVKGIDPLNMNDDEFLQMLSFIYAPEYNHTFYSLTGYQRATTDLLVVKDLTIQINGEVFAHQYFPTVYEGDNRIIKIEIGVDVDDFFLFMKTCSMYYFGFELDHMTYDQFVIISDVIRRFPEETIFDLSEEYAP